jgi:hypothetical protein
MREILIYGLERGETRRYTESLLSTQCKNAEDIERVKTAAAAQGWHSFRIAYYNGEPPNFAAAIAN